MLSQQNQCLKVRRFVVAFGCMHLRTFRAGELHLVNLLRRKATPQLTTKFLAPIRSKLQIMF